MLEALERLEPPEDSEERDGGFPTLEKMLPRLSFKSGDGMLKRGTGKPATAMAAWVHPSLRHAPCVAAAPSSAAARSAAAASTAAAPTAE